MHTYELTLVLPQKATASKKKSTDAFVEKFVKSYKGKIVKKDDWDKIDLEYPIKNNQTGVFMHYELELTKEGIKTLKDKLRLEDDYIRSLIVIKEDKK